MRSVSCNNVQQLDLVEQTSFLPNQIEALLKLNNAFTGKIPKSFPSPSSLLKPNDLLLLWKLVHRIKGWKREIVTGQIFENTVILGPFLPFLSEESRSSFSSAPLWTDSCRVENVPLNYNVIFEESYTFEVLKLESYSEWWWFKRTFSRVTGPQIALITSVSLDGNILSR